MNNNTDCKEMFQSKQSRIVDVLYSRIIFSVAESDAFVKNSLLWEHEICIDNIIINENSVTD